MFEAVGRSRPVEVGVGGSTAVVAEGRTGSPFGVGAFVEDSGPPVAAFAAAGRPVAGTARYFAWAGSYLPPSLLRHKLLKSRKELSLVNQTVVVGVDGLDGSFGLLDVNGGLAVHIFV